jgi:hypothetical protein
MKVDFESRWRCIGIGAVWALKCIGFYELVIRGISGKYIVKLKADYFVYVTFASGMSA